MASFLTVKTAVYSTCKSEARYPQTLDVGVVFFHFSKAHGTWGEMADSDKAVWMTPFTAQSNENNWEQLRLLQGKMVTN